MVDVDGYVFLSKIFETSPFAWGMEDGLLD